jgi:hypothetical protein
LLTVVVGATIGIGVRWYFEPYIVRKYWPNGNIGEESRYRRVFYEGSVDIEHLDIRLFYSNGKPSCEGTIGADIDEWKAFSPTGERISYSQCMDWRAKDAGDGTFLRDISHEEGRVILLDELLPKEAD